MKKIYSYIILLLVSFCWVSCNNEWEDEQYEQYVSFKAPIGSNGVTDIYIRYKKDGKVTYQLPVIISGSTFNEKDLNVKVEVDNDTLGILNNERFGREDLSYIIHSGFISGYQNRYGDNLKPPTNVYHRMTA